jgi:hypothetical protein
MNGQCAGKYGNLPTSPTLQTWMTGRFRSGTKLKMEFLADEIVVNAVIRESD